MLGYVIVGLICLAMGVLSTAIVCGRLERKEIEEEMEQKRRSANVAALTDQRKDD